MDEVAHLQVATTFHITDGSSERIFYFVRGGVRLLSSGPHGGPGLPGHLLETGCVEVDVLHTALEESRSRRKDLRQVLIDNKVLTKTECNEIISRLIRDELFELVFWKDAVFTVHSDEPPEEIFKLDRSVLHGAIENEELTKEVHRWLDDWSKIQPLLPSDQVMITTTDAGREASATLEPQIQRLLTICDEEVTLRQAWLSPGLPLDKLCMKLVDLQIEKMITLGPDNTVARSDEEEIAILEDSLRHLIAKDLVRERLASLYEKTKRPSKAVEYLETIAESALSAKNVSKAVERYKVILRLQPHNVGAFDKLLSFGRDSQAAGAVKSVALGHLTRLVERNLVPEAERCATLLETFPGAQNEVKEFKASLLASRGEPQEAATELVSLAGVYHENGDAERAIECLRKARAYDPSNADAQSELDRCHREVEERETRKTVMAAAERALQNEPPTPTAHASPGFSSKVALAAVILIVVGAGVYFLLNRESVTDASSDPETALAQRHLGDDPSGALPGRDGGGSNPQIARTPVGSVGSSVGRLDRRDARNGSATRHAPPPSTNAGSPPPTTSRQPLVRPAVRRPRSDPCDPVNFRTRTLSSTRVAFYADTCSLFIRDDKGRVAHEFPGGRGTRWAFSHGGRFICRWEPGERPTVFTVPQELELLLSWRIPVFTGALAIGKDRIVIRENKITAMFRFDGTPVTNATLPIWDEAVFVENRLVLSRQTGTRTLWVVEADSLDFLWSCHNEPDGLIIR